MEKQCPNCGSMLDDKMRFYISQLTSGHFLFLFLCYYCDLAWNLELTAEFVEGLWKVHSSNFDCVDNSSYFD